MIWVLNLNHIATETSRETRGKVTGRQVKNMKLNKQSDHYKLTDLFGLNNLILKIEFRNEKYIFTRI